MRLFLSVAVCLAYVSSTLGQQSMSGDSSRPSDSSKPLPVTNMSQPFPFSEQGFKSLAAKSALGLYGTDPLVLSNYGAPGVLIMGVGDQFNGLLINYSACHIWAIVAQSGAVNWGDNTAETQIYFVPPLSSRLAGTIKTPRQIGIFPVTATIYGVCGDWWRHGNVPNSVTGKGTAYVYDSLPITSFQINCGTTAPCTTIKGGQLASGVVTTGTATSSSLGTLVMVAISGPGTTVPYIIEPTSQTTIAFDIPTTAVTANTNLEPRL